MGGHWECRYFIPNATSSANLSFSSAPRLKKCGRPIYDQQIFNNNNNNNNNDRRPTKLVSRNHTSNLQMDSPVCFNKLSRLPLHTQKEDYRKITAAELHNDQFGATPHICMYSKTRQTLAGLSQLAPRKPTMFACRTDATKRICSSSRHAQQDTKVTRRQKKCLIQFHFLQFYQSLSLCPQLYTQRTTVINAPRPEAAA